MSDKTPTAPAATVIELTAMQAKVLEEHFAHVLSEAAAGRKGILCAQVYGPNEGTAYAGCIRVRFMPSESAVAIAVKSATSGEV